MLYIIEAISLIVIIFCIIKTIKNWWDIGIITPLVGAAFCLFILILIPTSNNDYSNTYNTVSSNTTQYDIVEFNKSTLINKLDESYIITYKTKDNNEFKISVDNDTNIVIDNDNPTKVIIDEELKYSDWFFAHKNTVTYTFQ